MKTCLSSADDECGSLTLIAEIHACSGRTSGERVMLASIMQWLDGLYPGRFRRAHAKYAFRWRRMPPRIAWSTSARFK